MNTVILRKVKEQRPSSWAGYDKVCVRYFPAEQTPADVRFELARVRSIRSGDPTYAPEKDEMNLVAESGCHKVVTERWINKAHFYPRQHWTDDKEF